MKIKLILISFFVFTSVNAQISVNSGLYAAKEFSKEQSLYKAKDFVITQIIGAETESIKFEIDPLAATSSGELTSLVYSCESKNISGLILGFYGNRWNESGVVYQAYGFKNFTEEKARQLLSKLDSQIEEHTKYINDNSDNNNVFFKFDDITFLIYRDGGIKIRAFWNQFDSEWQSIALGRTKRRFERKTKD
jgi:predicted Fe-Mo cluster-binding NifX family protein